MIEKRAPKSLPSKGFWPCDKTYGASEKKRLILTQRRH